MVFIQNTKTEKQTGFASFHHSWGGICRLILGIRVAIPPDGQAPPRRSPEGEEDAICRSARFRAENNREGLSLRGQHRLVRTVPRIVRGQVQCLRIAGYGDKRRRTASRRVPLALALLRRDAVVRVVERGIVGEAVHQRALQGGLRAPSETEPRRDGQGRTPTCPILCLLSHENSFPARERRPIRRVSGV